MEYYSSPRRDINPKAKSSVTTLDFDRNTRGLFWSMPAGGVGPPSGRYECPVLTVELRRRESEDAGFSPNNTEKNAFGQARENSQSAFMKNKKPHRMIRRKEAIRRAP